MRGGRGFVCGGVFWWRRVEGDFGRWVMGVVAIGGMAVVVLDTLDVVVLIWFGGS